MFKNFINSSSKEKGLLEVGEIRQKEFTKTVAFELVANLPLVEVEIAGEKYKFLFDTAALSVVPKALVDLLCLKPLQEIGINDSTDNLSQEMLYTLPSLSVEGLEFCDYVVTAYDFSEHTPLSCLGFDGILGYNFLHALVVKIDYENQEITFLDKLPSTKSYTKLPLVFDGLSGAKFEINFAFRNILVTLDTGKNDGISLCVNDEFGSFSEYGYETRETEGLFMSSFSGVKEYTKEMNYLVKEFNITKDIKVESYPVSLNSTTQSLVGNGFLENFDIILDFRKKQLYLRQYEKERITKVFNSSFGFFLHWDETRKLYISALNENSVASNAGLKLGDRILALDGEDTYAFKKEEYCTLFLALNSGEETYEALHRLELTIKRDSTIKKVLLKK